MNKWNNWVPNEWMGNNYKPWVKKSKIRNLFITPQLLETEGLSKSQELENLRLRLSSEEDRHNESRKEATKLRTKVSVSRQTSAKVWCCAMLGVGEPLMVLWCVNCGVVVYWVVVLWCVSCGRVSSGGAMLYSLWDYWVVLCWLTSTVLRWCWVGFLPLPWTALNQHISASVGRVWAWPRQPSDRACLAGATTHWAGIPPCCQGAWAGHQVRQCCCCCCHCSSAFMQCIRVSGKGL